jgi:hypothetical protein
MSTTDQTRDFHIGDIISAMTGKLVSPRHIGGVYDVLNYMTGDELFTHQLPRASRECEPHLREQHPDLAAIVFPDWSGLTSDNAEATVMAWLAEQVAVFGETRPVRALPADDHTSINPITELKMMRPDALVVGVDVPEAGADDE